MTIIYHPDNEPQLIILGLDEDSPGCATIPPRAEVELRGKFGPHVAFDIRVLPIDLINYVESTPRLTMISAFLYPPSEPDGNTMRDNTWGGGEPFREDLENGPSPGPMGTLLSNRAMITGSSIGIVVRNNTDKPTQAKISVSYTSIGGWCEMENLDETASAMKATNDTLEALRWGKTNNSEEKTDEAKTRAIN